MKYMRILVLLMATVVSMQAGLPERSDHRGIKIVPTIGKVTVDGKLEEGEWDRSGRLHVYGSSRMRHKYSADLMAMWDKEALYLGIHWRDPSPMANNVDAKGAPFDGWQADALQVRFVTAGGRVGAGGGGRGTIHCDAFYSSAVDYSSFALTYNATMKPEAATVFGGKGMSFEKKNGMAQAFSRDEDKGEYVQEIRIPWTLLYQRANVIKPGKKFQMVCEFYWGAPNALKWPMFFHQDPMSTPDRTNTYKSPGNWGWATIVSENNLSTIEPSVLDFADGVEKATHDKKQGVYPIRVEVPADAVKFTLAIDKDGHRYRNLVANVPAAPYVVEDKGDTKVIEVLWDGRKDSTWNYNWHDWVGYARGELQYNDVHHKGRPFPTHPAKANMVIAAPGEYTARVLVHEGIRVLHEGSFYNPGNPSWETADGSGGWLVDHRNPKWVATAGPECGTKRGVAFLSAEGGECGYSLIGIDRSGEKIWSWTRSTGKVYCQVMGKKHLFFGFAYAKGLYWGKVDPDTGKQVEFSNGEQDIPHKGGSFNGMDVHGDTLAIAAGSLGLLLFDTETAELKKKFDQGGSLHFIRFTPDGKRIIGIGGSKGAWFQQDVRGGLVDLDLTTGTGNALEVPGVERVGAICFDNDGRFYVGDAGSHTVKIFDRAPGAGKMKLLGTVAKPGGRKRGEYDPSVMYGPNTIEVEHRNDGSKRLWCVETSFGGHYQRFNRTSVWDVSDPKKVSFHREYLGNTGYQGTGAAMSDDDPTLGMYRGALYRVDFENNTYNCIEITDMTCGHDKWFGNNYHFFSDASGKEREYLTSQTRIGVRVGPYEWKHFSAPIHPGGLTWGISANPNKKFEWYKGSTRYYPTGFDKDGIPTGFTSETLPGDAGKIKGNPREDCFKTKYGYVKMRRLFGNDPLRISWGWLTLIGFDNDGTLRWSYPNFWWSTHGASTAPMAAPGRIIGQVKWTGTFEMNGHTYLGMRGYKGQDFLIRDDGMFISALFKDFREADMKLPDTKNCRGLDISDTSITEENFSGWMGRQRDGVVRLTYGKTDARVARVAGLESIKDLKPVTFKVTEEDVVKFEGFVPVRERKVTTYKIARGKPFDLDNLEFPKDALELDRITRTGIPRAMLRYDDKNLYIAYSVTDRTPWQHPQAGYATLFKTGDALGFMHNLDARHGTRIIMASPDGKDMAVVHRPRGPGSKSFPYTSPVRTVNFQHVAKEKAIKFKVKTAAQSYQAVVTIPWEVLGGKPEVGKEFKADVEVVLGGDSSAHVHKLLRWIDPVDSIHDLPTESEIWPDKFGTMVLQ